MDDEQSPVGLDSERHNEWVESLKEGVEFKPLLNLIEQLKEPVAEGGSDAI
jgi:hypothetical protein